MNPIHAKLLAITRQRVIDSLECPDDALQELSLGALLNILFLVSGHRLDLGAYPATFNALFSIMGRDIWKLPSELEIESSNVKEAPFIQ